MQEIFNNLSIQSSAAKLATLEVGHLEHDLIVKKVRVCIIPV